MEKYYKNKLVLVTGGSGFVGSHFIERLNELGARVRIPVHKRDIVYNSEHTELCNADLMKPDDCARVCEGVDYVIHAAGMVSGAGTGGMNYEMASIVTNLCMTALMLQAASEKKAQRFLLFSSSTGYPEADYPVTEEEFWKGPVHPSYYGYGWMRRYFERIGEYTHQHSDTRIAIVRPTAVYGERDDFDPLTSHVIPALIRRAVEKEHPFKVWGSPRVVRDFLHISDFIEGSLLVLAKHPECDPVNIGYGEKVTIAEIVNMILDIAGHETDVEFDESGPVTIPFRLVDISKARTLLGFRPSITLFEGLRRTVNWYRDSSSL